MKKPLAEAVVVKLGGKALESEPGALAVAAGEAGAARDAGAAATGGASATAQLAAEIASLGAPAVVVHGGGAEVSAWCDRLSVPKRFLDGLRVSDPATLEVAVAVLAGLANKRLVAGLRAAGLDAVGIAALDGGIVEAAPHPRAAELGAVGAVRRVRPALLMDLLAHGRTPVVASIADLEGALLNLNADDLAAALAGALGVRDLVLLSDAPGLVLGGAVVPRLHAAALERVLDHPEVQGGMRPKLAAAGAAIAAGVARVHITAWSGPGTLRDALAGKGRGTAILATPQPRASSTTEDAGFTAELTPSQRGDATHD